MHCCFPARSGCFASAIAMLLMLLTHAPLQGAEPSVLKSVQSGSWSAAATWDLARVPRQGDIVLVHSGHEVLYDVVSEEVIRSIHVSGTLRFSLECNTRLEVGLLRVEAGDQILEQGFDCSPTAVAAQHDHGKKETSGAKRAALLIGTPEMPIPTKFRALIRLHAIEGTDAKSWPAIVCCGGRMEIHGAPMKRTWTKLTRTADAGATRLFLTDTVGEWQAGDQLLITGTARQEPSAGVKSEHVTDQPASEVRHLAALIESNPDAGMTGRARLTIELDKPLEKTHRGGEYSAEVANLTRNVVIESADPAGARGHTMYHHGSSGSISYAEFRHLGKQGVLGRYPIHFHLVSDSMRGSSVIGASIWDSHNRWITVHGTQYLVVRDCVGFQSIGHGFFFEDGTEVYNFFDRNLAVQALNGAPLPEQVLPFDLNDGAGFWWANSLNAFTRNVATECDQHGFRFEAEKTAKFSPVLEVLQADGTTKEVDIRTLPFLQFDDNEVHCHRRFGLNLGGIRGLTYGQFSEEKSAEDFAKSIGGTTEGIGPSAAEPFRIRNFKAWDTHWAFHTFAPSVSVDGLDVFDCNYGIWRSVMDLHQYDNIAFRQIHSHSIFFPMGGHGPTIHMAEKGPSFPNFQRKDTRPPVTVITSCTPGSDGMLVVRGVATDDSAVAQVKVGDKLATSLRGEFAEWEVVLPAAQLPEIEAIATDEAGNVEPRGHRVSLEGVPAPSIRPASHPAGHHGE